MTTLIPVVLALAGFFVGALLFARVGRWIVSIYEVVRDKAEASSNSKGARLAAVALLNAGPWMLLVTLLVAYHVASEPWAGWLFGGACTAVVLFGLVSIYFARKAKSSSAKPAA